MNRQKLRKHKTNKAQLAAINKSLDKLRMQLAEVEEVSGKVTKSGDDFPYIEEHLTVRVPNPTKSDPIKARIREKEHQKAELEAEVNEVEKFIAGIPDGLDKEIFEMVYLHDMSQTEAGEVIGYTKGRISQIISEYLKD